MERFSESNETYSTKWLMKKLKDRYSDHLCFAKINSRKNVLFQEHGKLYNKWKIV